MDVSPDSEAELASLLTSLSGGGTDASACTKALEAKLDGPAGLVRTLLPRIWLPSNEGVVGDSALRILAHLVETRPSEYMALVASAVRRDVQQKLFCNLLVGPNSDDQVGIATDASASLLALCKWDGDQNHSGNIAKRVLSTIDNLWHHLGQQGKEQQRQSSSSQMRIAALMIDVCLLGGLEMSLSLSNGNSGSIMGKLLQIALDYPNDDPLLQVSALDQLERLAVHDNAKYPVTAERADFLLGNDVLRRGLLCLVGSPGDLSRDASASDEWGEADPINGGAALRLLTEICRVGVSSVESASDATRNKFKLLMSTFQRALHNFNPHGELERLSYIYAVSALVGSCAMVASSSSSDASSANVANTVMADKELLYEWLSLHSRVSQPKLKSTVLCSLSQVLEPAMWKDEGGANTVARPNDSIALQLYQAFGHANNERDSAELILTSAKSPFAEERLGVYNLLNALVMRGMCVRMLLLYNDGQGSGSSFLEWLLNQDAESTTEGKKVKYQIVVSLLSENSNLLGGLLPARAIRQLEEWKRAGPNYNASTLEMATE
ncbi:hypothetical protein ACHAXT_010413 [Thalassiosira profunda]